MDFVKFPGIEAFYNVLKAVNAYPHIAEGVITYKGKIKLHGTNAGIRIKDGEVVAQSRTQLIDVKNDNAGFARWVDSNKDYWKTLTSTPNASNNITVFGEWCGPGIMKGTAINQIPNKVFAVFAIIIGEDLEKAEMIVEPAVIDYFLDGRPSDVHVLPWYSVDDKDKFTIEYHSVSREQLQAIAVILNEKVDTVEPCDPWVEATFGVKGTAEGIVYYPSQVGQTTRKMFSDLAFKAKGEKHKVVKTKESVQIDPEVAKSVGEFVTLFVTDARLEQGVMATGGIVEIKGVGNFLKWMLADIIKESKAELDASHLTWEQVQKQTQFACRQWYIEKISKGIIDSFLKFYLET